MEQVRNELLFLLSWAISWILSDLIGEHFLKGTVGNFFLLLKTVLYGAVLIYFLFSHLRETIGFYLKKKTLRKERRYHQRSEDGRNVSAEVLGNNVALQADVVDSSPKGLKLVLAMNFEEFLQKGVYLRIQGKLYNIIWGKAIGFQYHIGLMRI